MKFQLVLCRDEGRIQDFRCPDREPALRERNWGIKRRGDALWYEPCRHSRNRGKAVTVSSPPLPIQYQERCHKEGSELQEYNFGCSIQYDKDKTFIYDLSSSHILEEIDTVHNPKGLCAFAPNSVSNYLAIPASTSKGSALVYKASEPELICQIDAHQSPLAAMTFSSDGTYLATASEKGTMVRVHMVAQATKSHSFRRGAYPSTIYSLSFGPSKDLPDVLVATSSSGSLHMFFLDAARNGRNQTNKLLGSIIPGSKAITDALDPANHHVIHNVSSAETKSCLAVHSVEYSQNFSKFPAVRTVVYMVTHDGYFREYTISTTKSNESSWVLEREFSLLDSTLKKKEELTL